LFRQITPERKILRVQRKTGCPSDQDNSCALGDTPHSVKTECAFVNKYQFLLAKTYRLNADVEVSCRLSFSLQSHAPAIFFADQNSFALADRTMDCRPVSAHNDSGTSDVAYS